MFNKIKIKNKPVIIVCSGQTLKIYQDKIKEYIKDNKESIIIGCKNISHIIVPHYNLWGDEKGFLHFGKNMDKSTIPVFQSYFKKKNIKKHWTGYYEMIETKASSTGKDLSDYDKIKFGYKNGVMIGRFKTTGCIAIFSASCAGAKSIMIVGMDGYSFYSKEELLEGEKNKSISQYCYGKGFANFKNRTKIMKKSLDKEKDIDKIYKQFVEKDLIVQKVLKGMKNYGVNFKIITPTVFKEFYDSKVLNIL